MIQLYREPAEQLMTSSSHINPGFVLLSPPGDAHHPNFQSPHRDNQGYDSLLLSIQQFRGQIYLKDGAIQEWQLDEIGRFGMRGDDRSWHLVLISSEGAIAGCARFLVHPNSVTFDELILGNAALSRDQTWGKKMRLAVETEIRLARAEDVPYVEVGGWALAEEYRGTRAALRILLASYSWGKLIGGCRSACTATVRHGSSSILRKIGATSLEYFGEQLPPYPDPAYGCEMELLRFDWRNPNPRFSPLIHEIERELRHSPIVTTLAHQRAIPHDSSVLVAC